MTVDVEIDRLGCTMVGTDRVARLSVWSEDDLHAIEAAHESDRRLMRLSLSPEDLIQLGHACIAVGRNAIDQEEANRIRTRQMDTP